MMPLLIFSFLTALFSQEDCTKLDSYYIVGNYKACAAYSQELMGPRCRYVKALCSLAMSDYDTAKFEFSVIGAELKKDKGMSELNGLALLSMSETLFMSGEYSKAKTLSSELNALLSKKAPYSYPYFVSELLLSRSYINSFDTTSALKRIALARTAGMEELLCPAIE